MTSFENKGLLENTTSYESKKKCTKCYGEGVRVRVSVRFEKDIFPYFFYNRHYEECKNCHGTGNA